MAEKKEQQNAEVLDTARLLLSNNEAEEKKILRSLGLDREIAYAEKKLKDNIIRKDYSEKYQCNVVHIDEIKRLCLRYRLFAKRSRYYKGNIPPELASELVKWQKSTNVAIGDNKDDRFFIVAPPKMFDGYDGPANIVRGWFKLDKVYKSEEKLRKSGYKQDPILLYALPEEPNYYAIVKAWGCDFALVRRFYGVVTSKRFAGLLVSVIGASVVGFQMYMCYRLGLEFWLTKGPGAIIPFLIAAIALLSVVLTLVTKTPSKTLARILSFIQTENKWNNISKGNSGYW